MAQSITICCHAMLHAIANGAVSITWREGASWPAYIRASVGGEIVLNFCPFCGVKLPWKQEA